LLRQELQFNPTGLERTPQASGSHPAPPKSEKPARKRKRVKDEDSDSEDELSTFRSRPAAKTNRPMIIPPVDKSRKQAIELGMAQIDPNASFAERVAQFDTMEAIAKKRKFRTGVLHSGHGYRSKESGFMIFACHFRLSREQHAGRRRGVPGGDFLQTVAHLEHGPGLRDSNSWHVSPAVQLSDLGMKKKKLREEPFS
jgi:hypothetical protein